VDFLNAALGALLFVVLAPVGGGLVAGVDRIVTARMQGRVGPPLFQPFYDVFKLMHKETMVVRRSQNFYMVFYLILMIFTGVLFFSGGDILLVIFALTLGDVFFILGGYKASSPFSFLGTQRELILSMAYEPIILLLAVGLYRATGSFNVADINAYPDLLIVFLPGLFIGFLCVMEIKFRKSPFDLSTSHHGHQELVKGMTTEFSGRTLAAIEVGHWYESVFVLGLLYLFFAAKPIMAVVAVGLTLFFLILADNAFARFKWQLALKSTWMMAIVLGVSNILVLYYFF